MLFSLMLSLALGANAATCPWAGPNKPTVSTTKHEVVVNGTAYKVKGRYEIEAFEDHLAACDAALAKRYLRRWRGWRSTAFGYAVAAPLTIGAGAALVALTEGELAESWILVGLGTLEGVIVPFGIRGANRARDTMVAQIADSTPPGK